MSFTGSIRTARRLLAASGETNLKKLTLELGGKSPQIVFADADLDRARRGLPLGDLREQGRDLQRGLARARRTRRCTTSFVAELADAREADRSSATRSTPRPRWARRSPAGSSTPSSATSTPGGVAGRRAAPRRRRARRRGREGARLLPAADGLRRRARRRWRIAQEEIFGPVLACLRFEDEAEALAIANGTRYGLAASIWTGDVARAHALARRVQAGVVWINCFNEFDDAAPFGGFKESGWGRDLSHHALDGYLADQGGLDEAPGVSPWRKRGDVKRPGCSTSRVARPDGRAVAPRGSARRRAGRATARSSALDGWLAGAHRIAQGEDRRLRRRRRLARQVRLAREVPLRRARAGLGFCDVVFGWDLADELYDNAKVTGWHTGYPDAHAVVDLDTARVIPWEPDTAAFVLDFVNADGAPFDAVAATAPPARRRAARASWGSCRGSAPSTSTSSSRRRRSRSAQKGFRDLTPLSPGMFGYSWLRSSANAGPRPRDRGRAATPSAIAVEGMHTETGPGVYETAIRYDDLERAADKAALFKTAVKEICARHGVTACFMAKWNAAAARLLRARAPVALGRGRRGNRFHDPAAPGGMSRDHASLRRRADRAHARADRALLADHQQLQADASRTPGRRPPRPGASRTAPARCGSSATLRRRRASSTGSSAPT